MSYEIRVTDSTNKPHDIATQDVVKEALIGETISFSSVGGTLTALECYDAEADVEISGSEFVANVAGVYRLKATATQGVRQILVRVVDPSVLAAIANTPTSPVGYGASSTPRLALRSIANTERDWDGTAEAFWRVPGIKLTDHGINVARN